MLESISGKKVLKGERKENKSSRRSQTGALKDIKTINSLIEKKLQIIENSPDKQDLDASNLESAKSTLKPVDS